MTHELYKRYRPTTLQGVVGQDRAVRMLSKMLDKGELPHALLLSGEPGTGKTTLARILAGRVGCTEPRDYLEVNASDDRGIDTVRRIVSTVHIAPFSSSRVYVLDEPHQILAAGQNALLKTLEEMPSHAYVFLCTTHPKRIIKAIHSRCTAVGLDLLKESDLVRLLKKVLKEEKNTSFTDEVIEEIADAAEGSARKALVILEQVLGIENNEERLRAVGKSVVGRHAESLAKALLDPKSRWVNIVDILKEVEEDPEGVRKGIRSYAGKVLLGGGKTAPRAYLTLCCFEEVFYDKAALIRACYEIFSGISS